MAAQIELVADVIADVSHLRRRFQSLAQSGGRESVRDYFFVMRELNKIYGELLPDGRLAEAFSRPKTQSKEAL